VCAAGASRRVPRRWQRGDRRGVGGTGTLTVSADGTTKVIRVSGAPDIYTVATEQPAQNGTVTIKLSPSLQAYSFTFG
jgi:Thioredoxin like C-terminal domain